MKAKTALLLASLIISCRTFASLQDENATPDTQALEETFDPVSQSLTTLECSLDQLYKFRARAGKKQYTKLSKIITQLEQVKASLITYNPAR
jgi:hypothetical protein